MSSETEVCSSALLLLGEDEITDIDGSANREKLCKRIYSQTRDDLLRKHYWNFSLIRVSLALDATAPVFGFDNAFTLPPDFIRVQAINRNESLEEHSFDIPYKIENGRLLTDEDQVDLLYVARITSPTQWDSLFRTTLEYLLASKFAIPVMNNVNLHRLMFGLYKDNLIEARVADAHDGTPDRVFDQDLNQARRTSSALSAESRPFAN